MLSSSPTLPSSTSIITAAAVNCFPTDPVWKIDWGVTGTPSSTFASPYPCALINRPSRITPRLMPGIFCLSSSARTT